MKLLLLKLYIKQPKDQGYVIPVVFALGLIMTLVGTISIFQSSDEQVISISQRQGSEALAAAETGIARYREQINKYKMISMYDACKSDVDDPTNDPNPSNDPTEIEGDWTDETCNSNDSSDISWNTAALTLSDLLESHCPVPGETVNDNEDNVQDLVTREWQNIGSDDSLGQYRLIDYIYDPGILRDGGDTYNTAGSQQPRGILTVEGRVNQNNTDFDNEPSASVARIQVILPIQPGLPNPNRYYDDSVTPAIFEPYAAPGIISLAESLNNFNPALWMTGAPNNIDLGNMQVNGNVVVSDGDCIPNGTLPVANDFLDSTQNSVLLDPRSPGIVTDPSITLPPGATDASQVREITLAELKTESLPLTPLGNNESSQVGGDTVYYYKLPAGQDLDLSAGDVINIRNRRNVILFVDGDVNITGGASEIKVNSAAVNRSSSLEIYLTNSFSSINFSGIGQIAIKAFIHAPEASVIVNGNPDISIEGALWVKDFVNNATNTFSINPDDQYLNYTYVNDFLANSGFKIADPIIAPPLEWNTQETN